jgi:phosphatidylglycerol:prolipoprotein diacylglycerol transferase
MIPYVTLPRLAIGSMVIQPFALFVSIGVLVAHFRLLSRAQRVGLWRPWAAEMSVAMVAFGFAGAILFKLVYRPDLFLSPGCGSVLPGISSFGGLFGALAGAWAYLLARRVTATERLRYLDAAAFAFPFGFVFGRLGCTLTHDHPGVRADNWLTVAYPSGARYDLGLLEMLFLIVVCTAFIWLDRRPRPRGFFLAAMLLGYGPFRVALDRLHVDPPRYAGISVDQWAGAVVTALGLLFLYRSRTLRPL